MSRARTVVFVVTLASCAGGIPRPRLPQVEQTTEAIQGGGERYRAHQRCAGAARTVDDLVGCMERAGWEFVPHGVVFPEADCWTARERAEIDRVAPHCFVRPSGRPSAPPP